MPESGHDSPEQVVVVIHGIRTHAKWAERVCEILEKAPNIREAKPIRYGLFSAPRLLLPFGRKGAIKKVYEEFKDYRDLVVKKKYPNAKISILAHSFGTYITSRLLTEGDYADVQVHRVALCGSIIKKNFKWKEASKVIGELPVMNDCGTKDIWPIIAASATVGYGATGVDGARSGIVQDRNHPLPHSGFFTDEFAERYWLPFFADGDRKRSYLDKTNRTKRTGMLTKLFIQLKIAMILILTVLTLGAGGGS